MRNRGRGYANCKSLWELHGRFAGNRQVAERIPCRNGSDGKHGGILDSVVRGTGTTRVRMSTDQFAIVTKGSREKERHRRRAMDPDPAQLWTAGKFVQAAGRTDRVANALASSQPTGGASLAAYPAYAKGVVADERAVVTSRDGHHRGHGADDPECHPWGRTRPAEVGILA